MSISQQSLHPLSFFIAFFVLAPANSIYAQNITPANDGLNTNVNQTGNQYNITGGEHVTFAKSEKKEGK